MPWWLAPLNGPCQYVESSVHAYHILACQPYAYHFLTIQFPVCKTLTEWSANPLIGFFVLLHFEYPALRKALMAGKLGYVFGA